MQQKACEENYEKCSIFSLTRQNMPFLPPKTIIAGPCSVETKEQLYKTTKLLLESTKLDILRAGIWKPRTSPQSFEGLGKKALPWLREIKKELNIPVAIEVASTKHVEQALEHDIDYLWLGARTTVSPFSVQELANALEGTKASVFIKNPINPDIKLWSGAVERIHKAGIQNIALIHRGFSAPNSELRYPPMWHLVLAMKELHKDLPMLCDPSHICGERHLIPKIAQTALNFGADGLMLESHFDPNSAWSDAKQQLTPEDLSILLKAISWPKKTSKSVAFDNKELELHQINLELEELLKKRSELLNETKRIQIAT